MSMMICPRCLLRMPPVSLRVQTTSWTPARTTYSKPILPISSRRPFSLTSTALKDAKPIPADIAQHSTPNRSPPAATSTSAAQPFSTPSQTGPPSIKGEASTPTPPPTSPPNQKPTATAVPAVTSSVAAGTVLRGLNYFKNKADPVALADEEYPPWLWTVLSADKKDYLGAGKEEMDPRLFARSAKARRLARKRLRLEAQRNAESLKPRTPLFEQSVDLPDAQGGGGVEAAHEARVELRQAMRAKRRSAIKETNFLKGMR